MCQWYLVNSIKLRDSILVLASFYLLPKRVVSKCAKTCLGAPAPTCSLAHGTRPTGCCPSAAGADEPAWLYGAPQAVLVLLGLEGSRADPGAVRCPSVGAHTCFPRTSCSPWVSTSVCTPHLGPAVLAGGSPATPPGPPGQRLGVCWLFSCPKYRCLTPPGAELGTTSHRSLRSSADCRQPAPAALLRFTLTPYSLFLNEAKEWDYRWKRQLKLVLGCWGITCGVRCLCRVVGAVQAEQSGL